MVKIDLNLDYCNECGDCCLLDCKSKFFNGKTCTHPEKSAICEMFPIAFMRNKYYLRQCKGVAFELLPISVLINIIDRLNQGKNQFEVKVNDLYCKVSIK